MGDTYEVNLKIKVEPELWSEVGDSISQNTVNMVTRILQEYHAELLNLEIKKFTTFKFARDTNE